MMHHDASRFADFAAKACEVVDIAAKTLIFCESNEKTQTYLRFLKNYAYLTSYRVFVDLTTSAPKCCYGELRDHAKKTKLSRVISIRVKNIGAGALLRADSISLGSTEL